MVQSNSVETKTLFGESQRIIKLNLGCPFANCCPSKDDIEWYWEGGGRTYITEKGILTNYDGNIKAHIFDCLFTCPKRTTGAKPDVGRIVQLIGYLMTHYSEVSGGGSLQSFYDDLSDEIIAERQKRKKAGK